MTSAMQDAWDDALAMKPPAPRTTSQLRPRSRSPNVVVASPVVARFAVENQNRRDEIELMRAALTHWVASVGGEVSSISTAE